MSWVLLQGGAFDAAELGYSIQASGKKGRYKLRFTLSVELLTRCGWQDGTDLVLMLGEGEDAGRARLEKVAAGGRKLRVYGSSGRAQCVFAWTEVEWLHFQQREGVYHLDLMGSDKVGINFKLPEADRKEEA